MYMFQDFAVLPQRPIDSLIEGIKVIDVDTHYTEPHNLWTSRAPASLIDRVPQVKVVDEATGRLSWVIDGNQKIGLDAMAFSTVLPDGSRVQGADFMKLQIQHVHPSSWDVKERLKAMDACNIHAQILYPNILGFGGQASAGVDADLRLASVQIYNDAMADLQEESGDRIFPMIMLPWWDPKLAVIEIRRMAARGLRGVNLNSDPQIHEGLPDLVDRHWDPIWEVCEELALPINFHIGASEASTDWVGQMPWKGHHPRMRFVIGGALVIIGNVRVLANLLVSGILDRFPKLQFVSVESGIGWIPFLLETLDHQLADGFANSPLKLTPTEYFARNFHGCFWFERRNLATSVRACGVDRVMFETDFPHPTCIYPESADHIMSGLAELTWEERNSVLSLNAQKLYRIKV
jgi:predicted TIM-barrel fold metal-dependent hydrolase